MMETKKMSYSEAKKIAITTYLSHLGFEPAKIRGGDYWYHSPFREERTPSFKVNTQLNVWYDHGTGEGGSILDLGARLHQCSLSEFVAKLLQERHNVSFHRQPLQIETPERKLEVISVNTITDPDLVQYLKTRGINVETAGKYCKEIGFRIGPRMYSAIGFPNQSGAYELRNRWFKGSSSPKDVSLISYNAEKLSVLEGFMDFLSIVQINRPEFKTLIDHSDFLILNSLRLLNRSLPVVQSHKQVNLFLDNDLPATEAKEVLNERGIRFNDASILYQDHKDVNEYLLATKQTKSPPEETEVRHQRKSPGIRR